MHLATPQTVNNLTHLFWFTFAIPILGTQKWLMLTQFKWLDCQIPQRFRRVTKLAIDGAGVNVSLMLALSAGDTDDTSSANYQSQWGNLFHFRSSQPLRNIFKGARIINLASRTNIKWTIIIRIIIIVIINEQFGDFLRRTLGVKLPQMTPKKRKKEKRKEGGWLVAGADHVTAIPKIFHNFLSESACGKSGRVITWRWDRNQPDRDSLIPPTDARDRLRPRHVAPPAHPSKFSNQIINSVRRESAPHSHRLIGLTMKFCTPVCVCVCVCVSVSPPPPPAPSEDDDVAREAWLRARTGPWLAVWRQAAPPWPTNTLH